MSISWLDAPAWAAVGWTMIHFFWLGSLIGLGAALGRFALRRAAVEVRYAFALLCLSLLVLTPGILFFQLVRAAGPPSRPSVQAGNPGMRNATALPAPGTNWIGQWQLQVSLREFQTTAESVTWKHHLDMVAVKIPWVWLIGTPGTFLGLALGLAGTGRLRRESILAQNDALSRQCLQLQRALGIGRQVAVAVSNRVLSPVLIGVFKPMILLPPVLLGGCTPAQMEMILLHELAHIRRWDGLINMVQRSIEALLFFHPVVWMVSRWVRTERELCCDAVVVRHTGQAAAYAEALAWLGGARNRSALEPSLAIARHPLVSRIRHILQLEDHWVPTHGSAWAVAVGLGLLLLLPICAKVIATVGTASGSQGESNPVATEPPAADVAHQPPSEESSRRAAQAEERERVVRFPDDRSLGYLFAADTEPFAEPESYRPAKWEALGWAKGTVAVPRGKRLRLSIEGLSVSQDFSLLAAVPGDALEELAISNWEQASPDSDEALRHLSGLTGLKVLSLEHLRVTERGLGYLRELRNLEVLLISDPPAWVGQSADVAALNDRGLALLAELPNLKTLTLASPNITDDGLAHLTKLRQLRELHLSCPQVRGPGLAHLRKLPFLRSLHLRDSGIASDSLAYLAGLASLRWLDLSGTEINDVGLGYLRALANLEELSLSHAGVTAAGIAQLEDLPSLKSLQLGIGDGARIGDEGAAHLEKLQSLEQLRLFNFDFTDAGLSCLARLPRLKTLALPTLSYAEPAMDTVYYTDAGLLALAQLEDLEELIIGSPAVTDQGLAHLARLRNLKKLTVTAPRIGNAGLSHLCDLVSLEELWLRSPEVNISGLNRLRTLTRLRKLSATLIRQDGGGLDLSALVNLEELTLGLGRTRERGTARSDDFRDEDMAGLSKLKRLRWLQGIRGISDQGMKHLTDLTEMERLSVGGPGVTDAGLAFLEKMQKLNHLSISGRFTDDGLRRLEGLKSLRFLSIAPPGRVSSEGLQRLQKSLPQLQLLNSGTMMGLRQS